MQIFTAVNYGSALFTPYKYFLYQLADFLKTFHDYSHFFKMTTFVLLREDRGATSHPCVFNVMRLLVLRILKLSSAPKIYGRGSWCLDPSDGVSSLFNVGLGRTFTRL